MEEITYFGGKTFDFLETFFRPLFPLSWDLAGAAYDCAVVFVVLGLCLLPIWVIGRYFR